MSERKRKEPERECSEKAVLLLAMFWKKKGASRQEKEGRPVLQRSIEATVQVGREINQEKSRHSDKKKKITTSNWLEVAACDR